MIFLSGCSAFDRTARDSRACEGFGGIGSSPMSASEVIRQEALPYASARLGRDLFELANLQEDLETGAVIPSPSLLRQVEQVTTRVLIRCSEVTENSDPDSSSSQAEAGDSSESGETIQDIEVDQGLLNVEVTIPVDLLGLGDEPLSESEIAANAEEAGYSDYRINADGSVTYVMSRAVYQQTLDEMKTDLDLTIEQIIADSPGVFRGNYFDLLLFRSDPVIDEEYPRNLLG